MATSYCIRLKTCSGAHTLEVSSLLVDRYTIANLNFGPVAVPSVHYITSQNS
jgi:hypothetical protein